MKGSIRFNNDIIAEVDVDPSAASGSRLTSCKNLIDGQELGGGGGSSDFSTAEVTVINTLSGGCSSKGAFAFDEETLTENAASAGDYIFPAEETTKVALILYKGNGVIYIDEDVAETSGNITEISGGYYLVTGDCSITTE